MGARKNGTREEDTRGERERLPKRPHRFGWFLAQVYSYSLIRGGGGDELVNRSYRDRAADDLGHRDVTRNLSREL